MSAKTIESLASESIDADRRKFVAFALFALFRGPPTVPSNIHRCSDGLVVANAFRAYNAESRNRTLNVPLYSLPPGLLTISIRPRPGRMNSAE